MHGSLEGTPTARTTSSGGFTTQVREAWGGALGTHAVGQRNWVNFPVVAVLLATLTWLVTVLRQQACLPGGGSAFENFCYSDLGGIQSDLGGLDNQPYLDATFAQPVVAGAVVAAIRFVIGAFGGGPGQSTDADATTFIALAALVLFAAFVVAVIATAIIQRSWRESIMLAISPVVVMTGMINLDLVAVALSLLGLAMWSRRRPVLAGMFLALATASAIYPGVLLLALLIVCLRAGRIAEWWNAFGGFLLTWSLVNLPIMLLAPQAWLESWTPNSGRGSFWQVLGQWGLDVPEVDDLGTVTFLLALAAIAAVAFLAPRRPRVAQVSFLVMLALLATNGDYRPQYALILTALMIIARPVWRDWAIFAAGEVAYVFAVWGYLGGSLTATGSDGSPVYDLAILVRLATELWVMVMVLRDIWRPDRDPVRQRSGDDPGGGPVEGADDVPWEAQWRSHLIPLPVLWGRFWRGDAAPGTPPLAPLAPPRADTTTKFRELLPVWLIGRGAIIMVGAVVVVTTGLSAFTALYRWDAERFMTIAQYGYASIDSTYRAFYPGWPLILSLNPVQLLGLSDDTEVIRLSIAIWGVVVSTCCSLIAALALTRLGGQWASFGWLFAPMAVFTMMPYSESLFCAFAFWAWQRARQDQWWQAAVLAGLASTVRVSGLFLIGALAVMIIVWSGIDWRGRLRRVAWLAISVAMLGAYTVYLFLLTGSWSAWSDAQEEGWAREFTLPWTSVENTIRVLDPAGHYADQPFIILIFGLEAIAWFLGFVVVGWCVRKKLWAEAAYVAVQLLAFSTSYWLQSVNRAILIWFPLWIMLAHLLTAPPATDRSASAQRVLRWVWLILSPTLMILWAWIYFTGEWAS